MSSDPPQLVDDTTPAVQYAPGWIWEQLVDEVHHTRHGAAIAGLTVSLAFSGTGIQVVGTLGSSDASGQPKTTYSIDGAVVGTYDAPFTPSGQTHYNVTFFSKRDLSPGDHQIIITNVDGTKPNTFWLDYFLIDKSPPPQSDPTTTTTTTTTTPSSSSTPPPSTTSHSFSSTLDSFPSQNLLRSSTTGVSSLSSTFSSDPAASSPAAASTSSVGPTSSALPTSVSLSTGSQTSATSAPLQSTLTSVSVSVSSAQATITTTPLAPVGHTSQRKGPHSNVGAIVGGVVGGVALLVLLMIIFMWRRRYHSARGVIEPFGSDLSQDRDPVSPHRTAAGRNGHSTKALEMSFNQRAFVSSRASAGDAVGFESHRSTLADIASSCARHSTPGLVTDVVPGPTYPGLNSTGTQGIATGSSTSLAPSHLQSASQSDRTVTKPDTTGSATSLLLHTEVTRTPWYAFPQRQSHAQSLLRAFTPRAGRRSRSRSRTGASVVQDVDSGLRTYNQATLPPPYTPE